MLQNFNAYKTFLMKNYKLLDEKFELLLSFFTKNFWNVTIILILVYFFYMIETVLYSFLLNLVFLL